MAEVNGGEIIARCSKKEGIEDVFDIMGGPMLGAEAAALRKASAYRRPP